MSTQSQATPRKQPREMPSVVTKERLSQIMVQEITEAGRVARQICHQSGSREVSRLTYRAVSKIFWENTLFKLAIWTIKELLCLTIIQLMATATPINEVKHF